MDSIRACLDRYGGREQRRNTEQADRDELLERAGQGRLIAADMDAEAQVTVWRWHYRPSPLLITLAKLSSVSS